MAYKIGATQATLVNADTVFYGNPGGIVFFEPKATPIAGGNEFTSMDGVARWRGFRRSIWEIAGQAVASYEMVTAILCSSLATGTVSRNGGDATQLDGSGTLFTTELAIGDTIIISKGSGVYELAVVALIHNATTLHVTSALSTAHSGATFRYRPQSRYSWACFVSTHLTTSAGVDVFATCAAVAICPDPSKLMPRWAGRYPATRYEFMLTSVISIP